MLSTFSRAGKQKFSKVWTPHSLPLGMITDNGRSRVCGAWPGRDQDTPDSLGLVENPGLQDHLEHCYKPPAVSKDGSGQ